MYLNDSVMLQVIRVTQVMATLNELYEQKFTYNFKPLLCCLLFNLIYFKCSYFLFCLYQCYSMKNNAVKMMEDGVCWC